MKNYSKMSTSKLNQLLTTELPAEDVAEIEATLSSRGQASAIPTETEVDEDSAAFIAGLESKADADADAEKNANKVKVSTKMTYDACLALAESLKHNVGHKCKVVPFNTITWEDGIIKGVVADKRSCKVLYAISCNDGRNIVKAHDSKMLQILEETAEISRRRRNVSSAEKLEDEALMALAAELSLKVGAFVEYNPTKEIYQLVEGKPVLIEKLRGVITAIVPDKRSGRILLKIENDLDVYDHKTEAVRKDRLITHKVSVSPDVVISDEYDAEIRAKYVARTENRIALANLTPADGLEAAKKSLAKSVADLEKLEKLIEAKKLDLETATARYTEWVESQTADAGTTEAETAEASDSDLN